MQFPQKAFHSGQEARDIQHQQHMIQRINITPHLLQPQPSSEPAFAALNQKRLTSLLPPPKLKLVNGSQVERRSLLTKTRKKEAANQLLTNSIKTLKSMLLSKLLDHSLKKPEQIHQNQKNSKRTMTQTATSISLHPPLTSVQLIIALSQRTN